MAKKPTAPKRAEQKQRRDRAAQEKELLAGLDKMRARDPQAFGEMMQVLAALVVRARSKHS